MQYGRNEQSLAQQPASKAVTKSSKPVKSMKPSQLESAAQMKSVAGLLVTPPQELVTTQS